ncbi:hypothetical protein [Sporolactobacillus terrae]|uniref:SWIM-type domain-containing protein n=1 Tax=Sporolactobacillus terrae TaxID=269673 RepID=A0A410D7J1_9BACL|nr:hypothetical protein [Sporolactobacillus terrae]QAA22063.1 hypothetical protein C0674_05220 [Sporolactobacillus terrae]QAA25036.1 hypothetical protein C0679_05195 [Sporolactobacillus terrae]UAK16859.1 hypothetical protein K7399_02565 [Sporolactobacillus terrae]BBN98354.1 hypothetical protein St703_10590 [Sporolactobacillus terrae]
MVRRITFRNARLAHWLSDFAATLPQNRFERGIMLYDKHRVWDYHASQNGLHASVEDLHNSFYQVEIKWSNAAGEAAALPNPNAASVTCSCASAAHFCTHSIAVVLYWIMRMDQSGSINESETAVDQGDSPAYQVLESKMKQLASKAAPSFQRLDANKLASHPELQIHLEKIVRQVMAQDHQTSHQQPTENRHSSAH